MKGKINKEFIGKFRSVLKVELNASKRGYLQFQRLELKYERTKNE